MEKSTTKELGGILNNVQNERELALYLSGDGLNNYKDFLDYYNSLEKVRAMYPAANIIKRTTLQPNYGHQILDNTRRRKCSRDKIIMLCMAAGLDLKETQRGLEVAKYASLYSRDRRDAVIIFCINHGRDVLETNEMLIEHGFSEFD